MPLAPATERAFEACFDAVLDQSVWSERLQHLGEALGARSCVLRACSERHDPRAPRHLNSAGHDDFSALWLSRVEETPDPHLQPRHYAGFSHEAVIFDQ